MIILKLPRLWDHFRSIPHAEKSLHAKWWVLMPWASSCGHLKYFFDFYPSSMQPANPRSHAKFQIFTKIHQKLIVLKLSRAGSTGTVSGWICSTCWQVHIPESCNLCRNQGRHTQLANPRPHANFRIFTDSLRTHFFWRFQELGMSERCLHGFFSIF